jgi:hypothetical protein
MNQYNPNRVPVFLEASTRENLIELLAMSQELNGRNWNCISEPKKVGKMYEVWFYADFTNYIPIREDQLEDGLVEKVKR